MKQILKGNLVNAPETKIDKNGKEYVTFTVAENRYQKNEDGTFSRTPYGLPDKPAYGGYDERYYRSIVNEQGDRLKVIPVE